MNKLKLIVGIAIGAGILAAVAKGAENNNGVLVVIVISAPGVPLVGAVVNAYHDGDLVGTKTIGTGGNANFIDIPYGFYTVDISASGYQPVTVTVPDEITEQKNSVAVQIQMIAT